MNICSLCRADATDIAFEETSHLGKRPVCYGCLGIKDIQRMKRSGSIILYLKKNKLTNYTNTLSFSIKSTEETDKYKVCLFVFEGKKWRGVMYKNCDNNTVICRKL